MSEENLETKLKGESDWKCWLPIYGMFRMINHMDEIRPTFVTGNSPIDFAYIGYQTITFIGTLTYLIKKF